MTQLLARDLDNDPLVFGVVGEEASRFFAVESVTGVVWLRQPLDREVMPLVAEIILCSEMWPGCCSHVELGIQVCPHQGVSLGTLSLSPDQWGHGE